MGVMASEAEVNEDFTGDERVAMTQGFGAGEHPIDFLAHRQRRGEAGAREDFEQMLVALVSAVTGQEAVLVQANPGDWGIDVLVGDLNGEITDWQAKYFIRGFGESQKRQVRESFASARKYAEKEGYVIKKWVLCIPCSLDAPTLRWWQRWRREQQAETGITIELWDESGLRRQLDLPEAATVRRVYYDPYRPPGPVDPPSVPLAGPIPTVVPWRGGEELRLGGDCYLLHDDAAETFSPDRSWVWREATADRIEPSSVRVWLRQITMLRDGPASADARRALRDQAALLSSMSGVRRLPRLLGRYEDSAHGITVASELPPGQVWREVFGPGDGPLDHLTVAAVLDAAAQLADSLAELHRRGHSHRKLSPDAIVMTGRAYEPVLRDAGLAAWPPRPGEGTDGYRAPEQARFSPHSLKPGAHTDLYQLAAVVHHTVTGHPPLPGGSPPIRVTVRGFSSVADELLARALDVDPRRRPKRIGMLAAALRQGRKEISRGGFS